MTVISLFSRKRVNYKPKLKNLNLLFLLTVDSRSKNFAFFWGGGEEIHLKSISKTYLEPIKTSQLSVKGEL